MMRRQRVGPPPSTQGQNNDEESSSDEDVFSKLARKQKNKKQKKNPPQENDGNKPQPTTTSSIAKPAPATAHVAAVSAAATKPPVNTALPLATTSSMKRHHKEMSGTRKARMDALLQDLEQEKKHMDYSSARDRERPPMKTGSFVDPDEEHVTTNIFVGNLAPTLTEEEVTNLFRQFGDLYSVKIMWPRTAEERARERHTGFVCFMNRQDAEDAMAYCDNADPFNVGRRLVMRWGKNVKKIARPGGMAPIRKRASSLSTTGKQQSKGSLRQPVYDPARHANGAIHVTIPASKERAMSISLVASYVAKDGSALEQLLEQERNPQYTFLRLQPDPTRIQKEEHIYYRWRVYSFTQGDGFFVWRAEPFVMFRPHGCFWIPPPMDANAAQQELEHKRQEEERLRREKEERTARRGYVTGRQLERARKGGHDGGGRLSRKEMDEFHVLFRQNLTVSRESICKAMAFCFEKGGAARQIADMVNELMMEERAGIESRVARLYLLSDILFNSQQPGVKNAFLYRDAIERFAPEIFKSLGKDCGSGRLSQNKLATAVSRVLAAWTSWSVYPPFFLDQLQDLFEGKEIKDTSQSKDKETVEDAEHPKDESSVGVIAPNDADLVSTRRKGEWKEIDQTDEEEVALQPITQTIKHSPTELRRGEHKTFDPDGKPLLGRGQPLDTNKMRQSIEMMPLEVDGEPVDPDGEPLQPSDAGAKPLDPDGEPLEQDGHSVDPDGEPVDADGEPLVTNGELVDPDGEPLEGDGEPEPMDADGEPLDPDGETTDGKPLADEGQSICPDGEPIDADREPLDPDGEPLDGRDPDGEPLD